MVSTRQVLDKIKVPPYWTRRNGRPVQAMDENTLTQTVLFLSFRNRIDYGLLKIPQLKDVNPEAHAGRRQKEILLLLS